MKKRRKITITMTMGLTLVPMLDMLTVVLIFLIVNFSPEKSRIKTKDGLILPRAEMLMKEAPRIHIQVAKDAVYVNGAPLEGLVPDQENKEAWSVLRDKLQELSPTEPQPVLLIADRDSEYIWIDRTAAHLAAAGFSDIYLLTEREERIR